MKLLTNLPMAPFYQNQIFSIPNRIFILCISLLLLPSCNIYEPKKTDNFQEIPYSSTALEMPKTDHPNLRSIYDIPNGSYKLVALRTNIEQDEYKAGFIHHFARAGLPKSGDNIRFSILTPPSFDPERTFQLATELMMPLSLSNSQTHLKLQQIRYYWNYVRTNKSSAWHINSAGESGGNSVLAPLYNGQEKSKGIYSMESEAGSDSVYLTMVDNTLSIYFHIQNENGALRGVFVYEKMASDVTNNDDIDEVSITVDKPLQSTEATKDKDLDTPQEE